MLKSRAGNSSNNDMLRTIFEQHWQHARHAENERLAITGAYIALLTATLAYFSTKAVNEDAFPLLLFLSFVSLVGLGLCMKLYVVFHAHTAAAESILERAKVPSMLARVDIYPISKARWLGVGALFAAVFQLGFGFFVYLATIAVGAHWVLALSLAVLGFGCTVVWSTKATRVRNEA